MDMSVFPSGGYDPNQQYGQELAALRRIQTDHMSRPKRLPIFFLSFMAFAVIGCLMSRFEFRSLIIVTIVMLVHELGHYIAMLCFGYRNLRMFFIPISGAAVSGEKFLPAFKETIVCLLGPIPGIAIGFLCGVVFDYTQTAFWNELARFFVLLNALNLLPIYPLDGGRLIYALFPHRPHWSQILKRGVLIGIGLMMGVLAFGAKHAAFLGGFVIASFLEQQRFDRMIKRYLATRTADFQPECEEIPEDIAIDLIRVADVEDSLTVNPKWIAQTAWRLWTRLRAERPGPKAAPALSFVYIGIWLCIWLARGLYLNAGL